ncbi:MAG: inositol monophosphatase [Clostridia bacterium]|nr:inositol monophosphatase [Clostridia bacterium]
MMNQLSAVLKKAGDMMLQYQQPRVYAKGKHADFVTEADLAVQEFLLEELAKLFPTAKFFAEEKKDNVLTDALTFIIDPIDGTTNYFRKRECSVISVGAVENKRPVLGAIFDPYQNRLYHAQLGRGAWCGETRLRVSEEPIERALIGLGTSPYYDELMELTGRTVGALMPWVADLRRTGSAAMELCDIASGRSDGCFEWLLQPWDYCAGVLLVEEAGGRCGNIMGGEVTYEKGIPFMAANAVCFEQLQKILQDVKNGVN